VEAFLDAQGFAGRDVYRLAGVRAAGQKDELVHRHRRSEVQRSALELVAVGASAGLDAVHLVFRWELCSEADRDCRLA
jgi:hypothetical protein